MKEKPGFLLREKGLDSSKVHRHLKIKMHMLDFSEHCGELSNSFFVSKMHFSFKKQNTIQK